jgi:hypothetical protein
MLAFAISRVLWIVDRCESRFLSEASAMGRAGIEPATLGLKVPFAHCPLNPRSPGTLCSPRFRGYRFPDLQRRNPPFPAWPAESQPNERRRNEEETVAGWRAERRGASHNLAAASIAEAKS